MATSPLTIFQGYANPLPVPQFNLEDYTAPALGAQASSGNTPYDKWLYAQNQRLAQFNLPAYASAYNQTFTQPQVQAPYGNETYTNQAPEVNYDPPSGYNEPPPPTYTPPPDGSVPPPTYVPPPDTSIPPPYVPPPYTPPPDTSVPPPYVPPPDTNVPPPAATDWSTLPLRDATKTYYTDVAQTNNTTPDMAWYDSLQNSGRDAAEADKDYGLAAGTTQSWINSNGLGQLTGVLPDSVANAPEQYIGDKQKEVLVQHHTENAAAKGITPEMDLYNTAKITGQTASDIDQIYGMPAGSTDAWIKANGLASLSGVTPVLPSTVPKNAPLPATVIPERSTYSRTGDTPNAAPAPTPYVPNMVAEPVAGGPGTPKPTPIAAPTPTPAVLQPQTFPNAAAPDLVAQAPVSTGYVPTKDEMIAKLVDAPVTPTSRIETLLAALKPVASPQPKPVAAPVAQTPVARTVATVAPKVTTPTVRPVSTPTRTTTRRYAKGGLADMAHNYGITWR